MFETVDFLINQAKNEDKVAYIDIRMVNGEIYNGLHTLFQHNETLNVVLFRNSVILADQHIVSIVVTAETD